ncbi:hypothetical protein RGQ29_018180 [Quercus rubra]|uniref:Uncharacterized protein n=1 Tax=Quercus rubra TaxID=3512 RepID=A0AAN7J1U1_QUERU|nr:hypothetical protein RGQ29_018180 [Quercus rubra]
MFSFLVVQNMNFTVSFLIILLVSLPHSDFAMRKLEDAELNKVRESSIFLEDDHVERKVLHEVHSGTNPISNSLPQQRWKPKLRGSPQLLRSP